MVCPADTAVPSAGSARLATSISGPSGVVSVQSLPAALQSIAPFGNVTALAMLVTLTGGGSSMRTTNASVASPPAGMFTALVLRHVAPEQAKSLPAAT